MNSPATQPQNAISEIKWPPKPGLADQETWNRNCKLIEMLCNMGQVTDWVDRSLEPKQYYEKIPFRYLIEGLEVKFLPHWLYYIINGAVFRRIPTTESEIKEDMGGILLPQKAVELWSFVNRNGIEIQNDAGNIERVLGGVEALDKIWLLRDKENHSTQSGRSLDILRGATAQEIAAAGYPILISTQVAAFDSLYGTPFDLFGAPLTKSQIDLASFQAVEKAVKDCGTAILNTTKALKGKFY